MGQVEKIKGSLKFHVINDLTRRGGALGVLGNLPREEVHNIPYGGVDEKIAEVVNREMSNYDDIETVCELNNLSKAEFLILRKKAATYGEFLNAYRRFGIKHYHRVEAREFIERHRNYE